MEEDFENDELDMEDGEGLDFDILTSNIETILDEPEMKKLLEEIGEDKETIISEIISDMESENKGVDFSEDEKESSYSKKCVRTKIYEKLMGKQGQELAGAGEPQLAQPQEVERFLRSMEEAIQKGSFSRNAFCCYENWSITNV